MKTKRFLYKAVSALAVAAAVLIGITAVPDVADQAAVAGGTASPRDMGWG